MQRHVGYVVHAVILSGVPPGQTDAKKQRYAKVLLFVVSLPFAGLV